MCALGGVCPGVCPVVGLRNGVTNKRGAIVEIDAGDAEAQTGIGGGGDGDNSDNGVGGGRVRLSLRFPISVCMRMRNSPCAGAHADART